MHEITERAVCNNRAGWIFWRHSLSKQAKNVRAGWKIIVKIVSEQGLILGTAEYVVTDKQYDSKYSAKLAIKKGKENYK